MTNRDKLIALMDRLALSKADVADLAKASPTTVDGWLKPETSKSSRNVPDVVLQVIEFAAGDKVCADVSEAADILGVTMGRVRAMAADSRAGLTGALFAHRAEKPLEQVKAGGHVVLSLGPVTYLLAPGWMFLPLQAFNGRRCKLGVRAQIVEGPEGLRLDTDVEEWTESAAGREATAEAVRLAEKLEEIRMLGERRADAVARGEDAKVRQLDRALAILDKQVDLIGGGHPHLTVI